MDSLILHIHFIIFKTGADLEHLNLTYNGNVLIMLFLSLRRLFFKIQILHFHIRSDSIVHRENH